MTLQPSFSEITLPTRTGIPVPGLPLRKTHINSMPPDWVILALMLGGLYLGNLGHGRAS